MPVDLRQLGTPIETKDGAQSKADAAEDSANDYTDSEVSSHENSTSDVHGVGESNVESESGAQSKVDSHEDSTSGVHGVGESNVESESGAQSKADAAESSANDYTDSEVSSHENSTSDVHGVGESNVESESGAQSKVDSHEDSTSGVHGVGDSDVASTADVAEKADDPHGNDAHSTDFSELDHDHTDTGESSVPVSGIDLPSVVVEKPEHLPIAELGDDESIELSVVVQDGETLEVYRWGAYDVGVESSPTGLDAELLDGGDVVQASENTIDSSDADTPIASHENTSGSVSVFKLRAKNDTGNAIDDPGVGSHFGYRVV